MLGHGEKMLVARPKRGAGRQPDGSKEMRIDVADALPEERVAANEVKRLLLRGDVDLRQIPQSFEDEVALP